MPLLLLVEEIQYLDAGLGQRLRPEFQQKIGGALSDDA
jgi:hypothetical protein